MDIRDEGRTSGNVQATVKTFLPNVPFWSYWKHKKTKGFLIFSGGVKREHWEKKVRALKGYLSVNKLHKTSLLSLSSPFIKKKLNTTLKRYFKPCSKRTFMFITEVPSLPFFLRSIIFTWNKHVTKKSPPKKR